MKKPLLFAAMALFAACSNQSSTPTADSTKVKPDSSATVKPIQSPYAITYSSNFVIDDPKNA